MLNTLTSKTKEQILEDAISSNFPLPKFIEFVKHWEKEYSEKIPEEIYPLIFKIYKKFGSFFKIKYTTISVCNGKKDIVLVYVSPVRKIEGLENIRQGNCFHIKTMDQFDKIISFLKGEKP
jgi:flavodoxin